MLVLDHLAVLGATLEDAVGHVQTAFGDEMGPGGQHARFGTHNRLMGLRDGLYLEAIAVDPTAPAPKDARWFGLDHFSGPPRLDKWICRVDDIGSALDALPIEPRIVDVQRGDLKWRMAVPTDGMLPFDGVFPALIEWQTPHLPGDSLNGQTWQLQRLTVSHPDANALAAALAPHLSDDRVCFETAPHPKLTANLEGPFTCQLT